jgi:hypothetical protein
MTAAVLARIDHVMICHAHEASVGLAEFLARGVEDACEVSIGFVGPRGRPRRMSPARDIDDDARRR